VLEPHHVPGDPGTFFLRPPTPSFAAVARAEIYSLYVRSGLPLGDEQVREEVESLGRLLDDLGFANLAAEFLEMASELLSHGHKDSAAVIAGAVLTDHLRRLAVEHELPLVVDGEPKPAGTLTTDLVKVRVYDRFQGERVATWLALRDDAVSGRYDRYDVEATLSMMAGVSQFLHWTLRLGAIDKSSLRYDPEASETASPTGWFATPADPEGQRS
jgi:hypothetical protein